MRFVACTYPFWGHECLSDRSMSKHYGTPRVMPLHELKKVQLQLTLTINFQKPRPLKMTTTSRDYRKMDWEKFSKLLQDRFPCEFPLDSDDPNELVDVYEKITLSVLDEMCLVKTKESVLKPNVPWYNDNIHVERCVQRRLERKWQKTRAEEKIMRIFWLRKTLLLKWLRMLKLTIFLISFPHVMWKICMQPSTVFSIQHPEFSLSVNQFLIMNWLTTSSHFS